MSQAIALGVVDPVFHTSSIAREIAGIVRWNGGCTTLDMLPFRYRRGLLAMSMVGTLALASWPRDAEACGGCFVPPIDNTAVSYHRMVLSISTKETTLYDQITYQGNPSSFAWVLPIRGTVDVGLSADLAFAAIDQQTKTTVLPPPRNCPAPPSCDDGADFAAAAPPTANAGASGGVTVLKQETVGPYETVQLESTNPNALTAWLESRGYSIPDDIEPLIATYVSEGFNFLALKLVPGTGVSAMRPIRITAPGAAPSLPLRMIAAGSGASVGVTLWVIGDGRWEPQTFPSFSIPASDITWTWATSSSDYTKLRDAKLADLGGAAWEIESSIDMASSLVESLLIQADQFGGVSPLPDGGFQRNRAYDPVVNDAGVTTKTSEQVRDEDLAKLFQGRLTSRVTRLRSDLPRASLATDLSLQAATDQATLSNFRRLTRESDEPTCPIYDGCKYEREAPRSVARARAESDCGSPNAFCGSGGGCSIETPTSRGAGPWALAALGLILTGVRAYRRRKRG